MKLASRTRKYLVSLRVNPTRGRAPELADWEVEPCCRRPRFCWFLHFSVYAVGFIHCLASLSCRLAVFDTRAVCFLISIQHIFTYLIGKSWDTCPFLNKSPARDVRLQFGQCLLPSKPGELVFPEGCALLRGGGKQTVIPSGKSVSADRQSIQFTTPLLINLRAHGSESTLSPPILLFLILSHSRVLLGNSFGGGECLYIFQ